MVAVSVYLYNAHPPNRHAQQVKKKSLEEMLPYKYQRLANEDGQEDEEEEGEIA
jgi:uncharacterized protein (UPF0216 family)